jgi:predicted HicB family RNase H-like nuclease
MADASSVSGSPSVTFDAFYEHMKGPKPQSIPSCLRAIRACSTQEQASIETLAQLVQSGSKCENEDHQKLARDIADVVVRSKFFPEAEKGIRKKFLHASRISLRMTGMWITELGRRAWNRMRYGDKTKKLQERLTRIATQAMFTALEAEGADTVEAMAAKFEEEFDKSAATTKGAKEFKKAFLAELRGEKEEDIKQYRDSLHERGPAPKRRAAMKMPRRLEGTSRRTRTVSRGAGTRSLDTLMQRTKRALQAAKKLLRNPQPGEMAPPPRKGRIQKAIHAIQKLRIQSPDGAQKLQQKLLAMGKQEAESAPQKIEGFIAEVRQQIEAATDALTTAYHNAPSVNDIPEKFEEALKKQKATESWVTDQVRALKEDLRTDQAHYQRMWNKYHQGPSAKSS